MIKYILIALLFSTFLISAQETNTEKKGYKYDNNFDLSLAANSKQSAVALSWVKFHAPFRKHRFKIGYGIRYSGQIGKDIEYITAPAELTSGQTGPQVLFIEKRFENIDTFKVGSTQFNSINVSLNFQYTIKQKLDIGFNIDVVGFTFGKSVTGQYISHQSPLNNSMHKAGPTSFNALLVSENDLGMLDSELYARYWFNQKWAIKLGVSYLFTEYTTGNKLRLNNDRWRSKLMMGMIGISFAPFN